MDNTCLRSNASSLLTTTFTLSRSAMTTASSKPSCLMRDSRVSSTTVVCIVEAMKLMNEIEAEIKGEIVEVLVENGQLVEYGQPLFLVRPE